MNAQVSPIPVDGGTVPEDLAEVVGAVRLMHLALEAAQGVEVSLNSFRPGPGLEVYPFRMLLTLLTYAYARGVGSSEEIQMRSRTELDFQYLSTGDAPDADTLRQFRRREWARIQESVVRLLQMTLGQGVSPRTPDLEWDASRRLEAAAAADSLALDY